MRPKLQRPKRFWSFSRRPLKKRMSKERSKCPSNHLGRKIRKVLMIVSQILILVLDLDWLPIEALSGPLLFSLLYSVWSLFHWLKLTRLEEPSTPKWQELSLEFSLLLTWDTLQYNAQQFHLIKKHWLSPVLMGRSDKLLRMTMDLDLEQLLTTLRQEMLA